MMENQPALESLDGSRNRDTPMRCPSPKYSTQEHCEVPPERREVPLERLEVPPEHHEVPQANFKPSQGSTEEHQKIPQAHHQHSRDSSEELHEIPQAHPLNSQDSTQEHHEMPPTHPLFSWDSSQEGGNVYQKHFNVVMVESHFVEEGAVLVDTGQGGPSGNALWPRPKSEHSKESPLEEENKAKDDQDGASLNIFTKSKIQEEEEVVIIEEEEDEDIVLVDVQKKIPRHYGPAADTSSEGRPGVWKADNVSAWGSGPMVAPEVLTTNLQTIDCDKPFSCKECGGLFKHKSSLVLHQRIHLEKKPYSCSECGKQFSQKANYLRHQRIHMGEKQYKCTECAQKQSLVLHPKLYAEVGPFSCNACGANFMRNSQSTDQHKVQKGLRHFKCPDCGDVFMLRSSLVIHQKVHSAEKSFSG